MICVDVVGRFVEERIMFMQSRDPRFGGFEHERAE